MKANRKPKSNLYLIIHFSFKNLFDNDRKSLNIGVVDSYIKRNILITKEMKK